MCSISACKTPQEKKRFERLPELLHGTEPAFIPPFPGSVSKILSPRSAFQTRHGEIFPFLAHRDGRPVGRIAAIVNRSHNAYHRDRTGFFGFFECENRPETAAALFAKAEEVLRTAGCTTIRGPYSPSINDECGLLTDAFDLPPYTGMTWNPPYYVDLLNGLGFSPVCTLYGLLLPMHRLEAPARLGRIVERIAKRSRLRLRPMNIQRLDEELKIVHEVYNATLERNWGFVPISMDDLLGAADDIKAIADPKLLLIAEMNGENAGVALTLPNFNEILARVKKTPHWLRLPHIVWLMKTHRMNSCRQAVLGVTPRFRDRGIHAWLIYEQFVRAKERYDNAILGWIEDSNAEVLEHCEVVGGVRERTWKIYEKNLPQPAGESNLSYQAASH